MTVLERLHADGRRLFVKRSLVPMALLPVVVLSLPDAFETEALFGPFWSGVCQWVALAIAMAGIAIRAVTVAVAPDGNSSRDTRHLRASSLTTTGVYSMVRHPLYIGNGLMWIGVAASTRVWWLVLVTALAYWLYIERIMLVEETYLENLCGQHYRDWTARTPAFIPRLTGWTAPQGTFSWKRLMSEHNGLLTVAIAFPTIQFLQDFFYGGASVSRMASDHPDLIGLVVVAAVVSVICVAIRRYPESPARRAAVLP